MDETIITDVSHFGATVIPPLNPTYQDSVYRRVQPGHVGPYSPFPSAPLTPVLPAGKIEFQYPTKGWECPKCEKVNAPWVAACDCHITTTTAPTIAPSLR